MVGVHSEFSPDLAQYQINSLKDPDLFTKEELIKILNTSYQKIIDWRQKKMSDLIDMQ